MHRSSTPTHDRLPGSDAAPDSPVIVVVGSFEEIGTSDWQALWANCEAPTVFAHYAWARAWWTTQAESRTLRVYTARDAEGSLLGLLPTVWPSSASQVEPVVVVGDEHADYAAVLIHRDHPAIFGALLDAVCADLQPRGRLLLRDVRSDGQPARALAARAAPRWSQWMQWSSVACPRAWLSPDRIEEIVRKESLRRHTKKLAKLGTVSVRHTSVRDEILPRLDAFFDQHVVRWASTEWPSLFVREPNRALYREWVHALGTEGGDPELGPLVFTEISVDGAPVAFHFGFVSENDFVWYKPTFDPELAKVSPGEVLIRELFLLAAEQGWTGFDFTRGDEAFKNRFADERRAAVSFVYFRSQADAARAGLRRMVASTARKVIGSLKRSPH